MYNPIPQHVAIMMDGNGRWARQRSLSRIEGHRQGSETAQQILKTAIEVGISYLTLYTFSSENWRRDQDEVSGIMGLAQQFLDNYAEELHEQGVRFKVIGDRERLPSALADSFYRVEQLTQGNTGLTLLTAFSYGGRDEILHAAKALAEKVRDHRLDPQDITEEIFHNQLYTAGIPDPELLIRTSGEHRISNYLLWQLAYAEFIFVDTLWPDFTPEEFKNAITIYQNRERRFGTAA